MIRRAAALPLLMLLCAVPAWANNPPSPPMLLVEILVLPLMMLFTAAGGGYAIMRARGSQSWRGYPYLAAVAIVLSGMHEAYGMSLFIIFGTVALGRAAQLGYWGLRSLPAPEKRPPYLARAAPGRLIASSLVTTAVTVFLAGLGFSAIGWRPDAYYAEHSLKRLVAYQLAVGKEHQDANGNPQYEPASEDPDNPRLLIFENLRTGGSFATDFRISFRISPDGRSFQAWVWPTRMPFFPYNYMVTLPSYYADQTGQIRMIRVHHAGQRCPPDAPVYYDSRPEDLRAAVLTLTLTIFTKATAGDSIPP